MKNVYVLDTSALIDNPHCFNNFSDSEVIIPIAVLNELDNLKKQPNEVGKNARTAIKLIDKLSESGDIMNGIGLDNNSIIKIDANFYNLKLPKYESFGDASYGDTQILVCAFENMQDFNKVTLISNDINLRIKAKARGMFAESREGIKQSCDDLYTGMQEIFNEQAVADLHTFGAIEAKEYNIDCKPNECINFIGDNGQSLALARYLNGKIKLIKKNNPWGMSSRSKEQSFAIDMIADKGIDLITMTGKAGCGKTLLALATALELVVNKKEYSKLIVYRPVTSVDEGIGYLPGSLQEKLEPWLEPIKDNFEIILGDKYRTTLEYIEKKGQIEFNALSYIRGRSIHNAIILIDDAQNISKDQMKTILTRAGENTKILLTGDEQQIDAKHLDSVNNGLTYVVDKFKDQQIAGHILFTKGERSRLATIASNIL